MTELKSGRGGHTAAWIAATAALVTAIVGGGGIVGFFAYRSAPSRPSTSDQTALSTGTPAAPTVKTTPAVAPGTKLGEYAVDLAAGYTLRFEPTKQKPQAYGASTTGYDLSYSPTVFDLGDTGGTIALYDGSADYVACRDDTRYANPIQFFDNLAGHTVCYTGRHLVVAARITQMEQTGAYVSLDITVWKG